MFSSKTTILADVATLVEVNVEEIIVVDKVFAVVVDVPVPVNNTYPSSPIALPPTGPPSFVPAT